MRRLISCIFLLLFLIPTSAFASGQQIYANGQYVGLGENQFNYTYDAPILHIPVLATAKSLGYSAHYDAFTQTLYVDGKRSKPLSIWSFENENKTEVYMPMAWATDVWGWNYEWGMDGTYAKVNFTRPSQDKIDSARIFINGSPLIGDENLVIINGRSYLPFRLLFENLGVQVDYVSEINLVKATSNFSYMEFIPGKKYFGVHVAPIGRYDGYYDASYNYTETPAFVENGRTYVPIRMISELLGAEVTWHPDTEKIDINNAGDRFLHPANATKAGPDTYYKMVYRS